MAIPDITDEQIADLTERARIYIRGENNGSSFIQITRKDIAERANGWLYLTTSFYNGKGKWGQDFEVYWHPERDELRYRVNKPKPEPATPEPEPEPSAPVEQPVSQIDISHAFYAAFDEIRAMLPNVTNFDQNRAILREHLRTRDEDGTGLAGTIKAHPVGRPERVYRITYNHRTREHTITKTSINPEDIIEQREQERLAVLRAKYSSSGYLRKLGR